MSKTILPSFVLLCLLCALFSVKYEFSVKASPRIWTVGKSGNVDFNAIGDAIDNLNVTDGDMIFVYKGKYIENVFVDKSVSLVGEDRDSTFIEAPAAGGSVISILANGVSIEGFTVRNSGPDPENSGISVAYSFGSNIRHNNIMNNREGLRFTHSGNNFVSDNIIANNTNGITVVYCVNNMVLRNTIKSNNNTGVFVALDSSGNTFYRNNFINNARSQVATTKDTLSVWDNGKEGNYWSDYTGVDKFSGPGQNVSGSDGIGDDPYDVFENNQDNYPLMGMFSDLDVALEEETYHINIICNSTISDFRLEIGEETGNRILRFNATGQDSTVGFCRVAIPTALMTEPYIVLVDVEEIKSTPLEISNETHVFLYFNYSHSSHTITIISSRTLTLYHELLDKYNKLQTDLTNLNATYYDLLSGYSLLLANFSQLQMTYFGLNSSYQEHLNDYSILLDGYSLLLANFSQLQMTYFGLNSSYQEHLDNTQNVTYISAAATAIFLIATVYLSKQAHKSKT